MVDRRSRPRAGLSREKVLDAAIAYVDEHGLDALSTRKLGAALGVEGMTLYHYVPSKAALLDGMVERLLEGADLLPAAGTPWPEAVRRTARQLRAALLRHPALLGVLATRPAASPQALRILEAGLALLREQGVPLAVAMDLLNAVTMFTVGHTLAEAGRTPGHEEAEPEAADTAGFPVLAEVFATGAGLDFDARFTRTVDLLIAGYGADVLAE